MTDIQDSAVPAASRPGRWAWRLFRSIRRSVATGDPQRDWIDVWTRTAPRYRRRAVLLLALNSVLFFGLGSFTYWLRSGDPFPFLRSDYWTQLGRSFNPIGEHQATLLDYLIDPISVEQAPMQIIVVGLLLASIVCMPILVAMLYRVPSALIFLLIVGFVAMLPWLALTLLLSCLLTALRPLRFSFRFATALLALIPVVAYFVSATRNPVPEASYAEPIRATLYTVPWILALVTSCVVMAIVLLIARIVNYRPGAISPLLALMFAAPVALFEAKVGRDELAYRLLEKKIGPHSKTHFRDEDATEVLRRLAAQMQEESSALGRSVDRATVEKRILDAWEAVLETSLGDDHSRNLFEQQQWEAVQECNRFCDDFPRSVYVPNVLYLRGRALDMRLDLEALRRRRVLTYYQNFPSHNSMTTWATLAEQYPLSPLTSVALLRLAQLEARAGRVDRALERLRTLQERFVAAPATATRPAPTMLGRLSKPPPTRFLDVRESECVLAGWKLRVLLENGRDPHLARPPEIPADLPLVELLRCDPRHRLYARNVSEIRAKYPLSSLRNRLWLEEILTDRSTSRKIARLEEFVQSVSPDRDAVPEALYRLGEACLKDSRPQDAARYFHRVINEHPESPWVVEAREQIGQLASVENTPQSP